MRAQTRYFTMLFCWALWSCVINNCRLIWSSDVKRRSSQVIHHHQCRVCTREEDWPGSCTAWLTVASEARREAAACSSSSTPSTTPRASVLNGHPAQQEKETYHTSYQTINTDTEPLPFSKHVSLWRPSKIQSVKRCTAYLSLQRTFPFNSYTASSASRWSSNSYTHTMTWSFLNLTHTHTRESGHIHTRVWYSPQSQNRSSGWSPGCVRNPWRTSPHLSPGREGSGGR